MSNEKEGDLVPECVQQAIGLLIYMKHELDYLPDDIIDRIDGVIHSIECEDRWDGSGDWLVENELWQSIFKINQATYNTNDPLENEIFKAKAISNLFIQKKEETWVRVKDRLPEPFINVLVSDGNYSIQGYYTNNYGWLVSTLNPDSVTHWMELPSPPKQ